MASAITRAVHGSVFAPGSDFRSIRITLGPGGRRCGWAPQPGLAGPPAWRRVAVVLAVTEFHGVVKSQLAATWARQRALQG